MDRVNNNVSRTPAAPPTAVERLRADPGLVVLEGFHALKHALRFGAAVEVAVTSDPDGVERLAAELAPDIAGRLRELVVVQPATTLRELVPRMPHTRIVAVARRPTADPVAALGARPDAPVVLLEDPRHLGNVGAVVRVAAAAGAAGVLTTGERDPWHPAALRGSAGLHFALPVARVAGELPSLGDRPLVALTPEGDELVPGSVPRTAVLAFGTERHGLSDALLARADARLRLRMRPGVSSLNLATAVAAALYAGVAP
jgi:TrmH family RNA methyltransferase